MTTMHEKSLKDQTVYEDIKIVRLEKENEENDLGLSIHQYLIDIRCEILKDMRVRFFQ